MSAMLINLIPWRARKLKSANIFFAVNAILVAITAVFFASFFDGWLQLKTNSYQSQISYVNQEKAKLGPKLIKIKSLDKEKAQWFKKMQIIQKLQTDRNNIVEVFNNLVKVVPEGLFFTYLKWEGASMVIHGVTDDNRNIAKLMTNLEQLGWNATVRLTEIARAANEKDKVVGGGEIQFSIDVKNVIRAG